MTTKPKKRGRKPGTPKSGGRKKGTPNKITVEVRAAANELVDNPKYRAKLQRDLVRRKVHPTIEQMLWHYGKGKPVERVESGKPGDFSQLTDDQINEELRKAAEEPLL